MDPNVEPLKRRGVINHGSTLFPIHAMPQSFRLLHVGLMKQEEGFSQVKEAPRLWV